MKKTIQRDLITINIERDVWKEIQMIKIRGGYNTINDVLKVLLGKR
jgi:hypothetical protein